MTSVDVEQFRTALLAERKRVLEAIEFLHEESPRSPHSDTEMNLDNHLAESASITLEHEIEETLEGNAEHVLTEIDDALGRIDAGTFGTCVRCGQPISPERLEAIPYATQCIDCKRREERG
jgi:DnaK suppressor protein